MKRLVLMVIASVLTLYGTVLLAGEPEHSSAKHTMPMMQEMHSHMQTMQEQMKRINESEDSQTREKLMREHMQSMREGMTMMMGKMDKPEGMKKGATGQHNHGAPCKQDDGRCLRMQEMEADQRDIQQRMEMMQMMMQQMMEHQTARDEAKP